MKHPPTSSGINTCKNALLLPLFLHMAMAFMGLDGKAQGYLTARGKQLVDEQGKPVLLKGIGLGGWMLQEGYMLGLTGPGQQQHKIRERISSLLSEEQTQEFYDTWWSNHTRKTDIDSLRAWGFNSVRLPMHYNLYTLPVELEPEPGKNTWLTKGFAMTDSLLSWCKANRMYLILDLHAAPGGQGNDVNISDRDTSKPSLWESAANQAKTVALWKELAKRYVDEAWIGGYDLINEPNIGFTDPASDPNGLNEKFNAPLLKLLKEITTAIRSVDKKHLIIIEGNGWGNNYNGIVPDWDNNLAMSFHKYWNYNDEKSIQQMVEARDKYNLPVWLGETGENSNVWFTQAIRLLESNNIGWCWWPLKKIGVNNPLGIRSNLNYDALLEYWNKGGKAPKESNVYSGLLELATYTRIETNSYQKDVIDAMMRQPWDARAKPFAPHRVTNGYVLKAVDYDLGRNGIAYLDMDTANYRTSGKPGTGNKGHQYRNDGVDISKDDDEYESYFISHTEAGEWLQYTITIQQTGVYNLQLLVATADASGSVAIQVGTGKADKTLQLPFTGGLNTWKTVTMHKVALRKGIQVLKFRIRKGGFHLKSIRFSR